MKSYSTRSSLRKTLTIGYVLILLGAGTLAFAQEPASPNAPQPNDQQAPEQKLSSDQLDNLVAPIALYPDPLLNQASVACTYPLEVE